MYVLLSCIREKLNNFQVRIQKNTLFCIVYMFTTTTGNEVQILA